jgi:hypothetical protein
VSRAAASRTRDAARRRAVRVGGCLAGVLLLSGCSRPATDDRPPQGSLVNASRAELHDVAFVGHRGLLAPVVARLAPGDSVADTLAALPEDAVFVTFVADGMAHVSDDSALVHRPRTRAVRFVVGADLRARVAGLPGSP